MKIDLPSSVKYIIETLNHNGYEAYVVGGCVRDSILHKIPKDWDITTNALPDSVKSIFKDKKIIDTGIKHGTVTIILEDSSYEITTFRLDGEYRDNRHPHEVHFVNDLIEDLSRRDFTINAMAYNDKLGLIDPFNGQDDISNKLIRCVGVPDDRFTEDALRILRAVRFSTQLGFKIELAETLPALLKNAYLLKNISVERIRDELIKTLNYGYSSLLKFCLKNANVLDFDYNEDILLNNTFTNDYLEKLSLIIINNTENIDFNTDTDKARQWLKNLKLSNSEIDKILKLIKAYKYVENNINTNCIKYDKEKFEKIISRHIYKICEDGYYNVMNMFKYVDTNIYLFLKNNANEKYWCHNLSMLNINGNDIKDIGFVDKDISKVLDILLEEVICENTKNNIKDLKCSAHKIKLAAYK